jgi:hypothetical protein
VPRYAGVHRYAALILIADTGKGAAQLTIDADSQYRMPNPASIQGLSTRHCRIQPVHPFFPCRSQNAPGPVSDRHGPLRCRPVSGGGSHFQPANRRFNDSPLDNEAFFMLSRSHARQGMIEQAMVDLHNLMALSSRKRM